MGYIKFSSPWILMGRKKELLNEEYFLPMTCAEIYSSQSAKCIAQTN